MAAFDVTTKPTSLDLEAGGSGSIMVVVSNRLGRAVLGQIEGKISPESAAPWLAPLPPSEAQRRYEADPAATATFEFKVAVPASATTQDVQFKAIVRDALEPDDTKVEGQTVGIKVTAAEQIQPKGGIPWWVWPIVAVVVIGAGVGLYFALRSRDEPEAATKLVSPVPIGARPARYLGAANEGVVSRIPTSVETFWAKDDGSVWHSWWYEPGPWQTLQLSAPGSASPAVQPVVVSRIPVSMEAFWVGPQGSIEDAFWYEVAGDWTRFQLAPPGSAAPGGGIAVVSRIPNSMEAWWIGPDGSVEGAFWYEGGAWQRYQLAPAKSASPTGGITAISRLPNVMQVFWIGPEGSIEDSRWQEGGVWQRSQVAPARSAAEAGALTVSARIPEGMELWWLGGNGEIEGASWYQNGTTWQRYRLGKDAAVEGDIAAASRAPQSLEVFWIGKDGSVQDAYADEGKAWAQRPLAPANSAGKSGFVAAVSRVPTSVEVFFRGASGSIQDALWSEGKAWQQPSPLP